MKQFILTSILVVLLACAQSILFSQWSWQSPSPQGNNLLHVQFVDANIGWTSGEYGTILRSSDGGATWEEQEYARTDNVLSLSMVSSSVGYAAGDNGVILSTTDGGDNWNEQSSGTAAGLNSIFFVDQSNGWAAGDNQVIVHTTNGGLNWSTQHQSPQPFSINDIKFISGTDGWGVGSSLSVFHTTDGGTTWTGGQVSTGSGYLTSISFVSASVFCIVGSNGTIVKTVNGGATWSALPSGVGTTLNDVLLKDASVGWAVGDGGVVLKTTNGGASWSLTHLGVDILSSITRVGSTLWIAGEYGRMFKSTNEGDSWTEIDAGSRLSANWIDAASRSVATVVGETGLILRTTDGGRTWNSQSSPQPSVSCYGVKFTDSNHGWAVGEGGTILRTTDGGTWTEQSSPVSHVLFGVAFSGTSGWIVGGEFTGYTGVILHSVDGGNSWGVQSGGISSILYGLDFPTASSGWAVGEAGLILHTTNGGASWNPQSSGTSMGLFWCKFADALNGWIVGDAGTILHTTNGGASWSPQNSGTSALLFSIAVSNSSHVIICGDGGSLLETTDGGANWQPVYSRTLYGLFGISNYADDAFWACGDYGTIISNAAPLPQTGIATGRVFNDLNSSGAFEAGDYELYGWKVRVTGTKSDSGYTAGDGTFSIPGLPFGSYTLSEVLQPGWAQTAPAIPGTYDFTLTPESTSYSGEFGNHPDEGVNLRLADGWNLLSLPVNVPDQRTNAVFPTAISQAFAFQGSYIASDSMQYGEGYWMKFSSFQNDWVFGSPFHSDTMELREGWNIIGCISDSVPVGNIQTSPQGIITSQVFGYQNGYYVVSKIGPGGGYWVKCSQAGVAILGSAATPSKQAPLHPAVTGTNLSGMGTLTFSDASGYSQTLYFGSERIGDAEEDIFALPPLPPAGAPDVRFSDNNAFANFSGNSVIQGEKEIMLASINYPVRLTWTMNQDVKTALILREATSFQAIARIERERGETILRRQSDGKLILSVMKSPGVPMRFALLQNMPNPFNPATKIGFQLPVASLVTLRIYNILGQEIATLLNRQVMSDGDHEVTFDAAKFPSGIYFYRFNAQEFSATEPGRPVAAFMAVKKMLLLK